MLQAGSGSCWDAPQCTLSFKDLDMRNLQFYFLESELEQAVGRARLLRHPCTVYLFSNFPCRQAEIIQGDYICK